MAWDRLKWGPNDRRAVGPMATKPAHIGKPKTRKIKASEARKPDESPKDHLRRLFAAFRQGAKA